MKIFRMRPGTAVPAGSKCAANTGAPRSGSAAAGPAAAAAKPRLPVPRLSAGPAPSALNLLHLLPILGIFLIASCASIPNARPLSEAEVRALQDAGGDPALFERMLEEADFRRIDSMLIYREGRLVFERYRSGHGPETLHDIRSSTKAITSLLVGIAIHEGFIPGVDTPILDFFPERADSHGHFAGIRIRDLLTMSSGLDSDDWYRHSPGNEEIMYRQHSWVEFFFSLEPLHEPGSRFSYSTAGVVLLGELVARAAGMSFDDFAERYLFSRLGIRDYSWEYTPAGEVDSGGHLRISSRDFGKIGLMVMAGGRWQGEQIVPEEWIHEATTPAMRVPGAPDSGPYMGYLWWQEPVVDGRVRSFQSRGNGGQYLIALPELDLLAVFTGSAYNSDRQRIPFHILQTYVIPAFSD